MKRQQFDLLEHIRNSPCGKLNQHLFEKPKEKKSKRPKYNNEKVEYLGEVFDSRKEYNRYRELLLLLKAGVIGQLRRQVKYLLIEANETEKKCEYWADFQYTMMDTGIEVVEDVKSEATRKLSTYIIKRKLMLSVHGISIKEV